MLSDNVSTTLTSVLDKISSQQFRIGQRLQWAAGANPTLNSVVDEFERAMNRRKQILQQEEELYLQICEYCEAVIHLESSHTRVSNKTENDKDTIILLERWAWHGRGFVDVVRWTLSNLDPLKCPPCMKLAPLPPTSRFATTSNYPLLWPPI